MIEQEPQSADMCDCILEQIRIVLSVQEMRVGPGFIALARQESVASRRSAAPGTRHRLFYLGKPV